MGRPSQRSPACGGSWARTGAGVEVRAARACGRREDRVEAGDGRADMGELSDPAGGSLGIGGDQGCRRPKAPASLTASGGVKRGRMVKSLPNTAAKTVRRSASAAVATLTARACAGRGCRLWRHGGGLGRAGRRPPGWSRGRPGSCTRAARRAAARAGRRRRLAVQAAAVTGARRRRRSRVPRSPRSTAPPRSAAFFSGRVRSCGARARARRGASGKRRRDRRNRGRPSCRRARCSRSAPLRRRRAARRPAGFDSPARIAGGPRRHRPWRRSRGADAEVEQETAAVWAAPAS